MGKKRLTPLVQAMNLYDDLDDRDKATFADYVRSKQKPVTKPRTTSKRKLGEAVKTAAASGSSEKADTA